MQFSIQFVRFRRGVPEPIRTVPCHATDAQAALEDGRKFRPPPQADGIRVLDSRGRCLKQWRVGDQ